jgi:dihydrofolate synthase / folylpolyglutamate synthase
MGFREADAYLEALGIDAMKSLTPTLHRIETVCELLAHPERAVPAVHITGTNGKTSTARIVSSVLSSAGLTVGTYTSPHLETIRERLAMNGESISKEDFGDVFDHILPIVQLAEKSLGETLSYFEILTSMFFLWAAESPVDAMVVEVGLGGRWDATNVIHAPVAVITNVGFDHTGLLGSEREVIAAEKAGIIKPGATAVTGERLPSVVDVISQEADDPARLHRIDREFAVTDNRVAFGGRYLSIETSARPYGDLFLPLHGPHQGVNAAVALEAVVNFLPAASLAHDVVAEGFAQTTVPGRLETLRPEDEFAPVIVLDVAHNPDGASALVGSLIEAFAFERAVVILGVLGDKDYVGILREIARLPCTVIATQAKTVRSVLPGELMKAAHEIGIDCEVVDDVASALKRALEMAAPGDIVCITGSHYVVGEARSFLI